MRNCRRRRGQGNPSRTGKRSVRHRSHQRSHASPNTRIQSAAPCKRPGRTRCHRRNPCRRHSSYGLWGRTCRPDRARRTVARTRTRRRLSRRSRPSIARPSNSDHSLPACRRSSRKRLFHNRRSSCSSTPTAYPLASDRSCKSRCRVGRPLDARPSCKRAERRRGYTRRRCSVVCLGTRPGHKSQTRRRSPKMRRSLPYRSLRSNPKSRRCHLSRPYRRALNCQLCHSSPRIQTCLPYRRRPRARRSCRRTPRPTGRSPHQTPDALKSSRDPYWHYSNRRAFTNARARARCGTRWCPFG